MSKGRGRRLNCPSACDGHDSDDKQSDSLFDLSKQDDVILMWPA